MSSNEPAASLDHKALLESLAGTKVAFRWFGTSKALSDDEKQDAASTLGADAKYLSLSKTLINTKNPVYSRLTKLRAQIRKTWNEATLPWVEPGCRLLPLCDKAGFVETIEQFQHDLMTASMDFGARYEELLSEVNCPKEQGGLGPLWRRADYPESGYNLFNCELSWPNLMPPSYLNPEEYQRELAANADKLEQAITKFEEQATETLVKLVETLADKLKPNPDGTQKTFHATAVENFHPFLEQFARLNFRKDSELSSLVAQVSSLVSDVDPVVLRVDRRQKARLSEGLEQFQQVLDASVLVKRKRAIDRPPVLAAVPAATAPAAAMDEPSEPLPLIPASNNESEPTQSNGGQAA